MQATRHAATMPNTLVAERAAQQQREPRKAEELDELALPGGTLLEGLRIVRPIGKGGFGIVYLAWDSQLERHVAIKEYMPSALVRRARPSLDLEMRSEEDREVFEAGRRSFVNEARLLARFDHPSLVKVFRFWEAHRTAYMAMPYYQGPTLKTALCSLPGPATEEQLRGWLDPIMEALAVLHREKCFHRDVSPDNILLTATGPLLLDFGAARRVISDRTQALTAVLKPGFAPIEQYGGTQLQGPWTDLYALAGVMHYAITGRPPVAAAARVVQDTRQALAETHAGHWRHGFLQAIDAALALRPEDRPQDVAAFRALLDAGQPGIALLQDLPALDQREIDTAPGLLEATVALGEPTKADCWDSTVAVLPQGLAPPSRRRGRRARVGSVVMLACCLLFVCAASWWWKTGAGEGTANESAAPIVAPAAPSTPASASASTPALIPAPAAPSTPVSALAPVSIPAPTPASAGTAQGSESTAAPSPAADSMPPKPSRAQVANQSIDDAPTPAQTNPPGDTSKSVTASAPSLAPPAPALAATPKEGAVTPQAGLKLAPSLNVPRQNDAPANAAHPAPATRTARSRAAQARPVSADPQATSAASRSSPALSASVPTSGPASVAVADANSPKPARTTAAAANEPHPARCSELILKSSLDSLRPDEVVYLKKECR